MRAATSITLAARSRSTSKVRRSRWLTPMIRAPTVEGALRFIVVVHFDEGVQAAPCGERR